MNFEAWKKEYSVHHNEWFEIYQGETNNGAGCEYDNYALVYVGELCMPQLRLLTQFWKLREIRNLLSAIMPYGFCGRKFKRGDVIVLHYKEKQRAYLFNGRDCKPCAEFLKQKGLLQADEQEM